MKQYRDCGADNFNTGGSKCPFDPEFIEKLILTPIDMEISKADLETKMSEMTHADRPNRIYPIGPLAEYAPSGGEFTPNQNGYAASSGGTYSKLVESWTLAKFDMGVYNNLLMVKSQPMRVIFIDRNGMVYAEDLGDKIRGFELSSVYPSGSRFKTSGDTAKTIANLAYKDVERAWMKSGMIQCETSILDAAEGLVWVKVVKVGTSGSNYKLIEKYGGLDLTKTYGSLLGSAQAWANSTAVTYNAVDGTLSLTVTGGEEPKLKSPSALFEAGIKGIEQWI